MNSLMHHGVKGQRWGVRRYQNKDGTRTAVGKKHEKTNRLLASTSEDYTSIVKSLSDHDLKMLNYDDEEIKYMREHETLGHDHAEYGQVAHRVIQKDKNGTPVAYVDATGFTAQSLLTGKMAAKVISIDLATKAGDEYRGKGYAIAAGKKMVKWFDTYGYKDYEYMEWAAKEENVASQKVAEKLGFKNYHTSDPGWTLYTYEHKAKHTSIGGTMYIEGNTLILGDSSYLEHHGILGQKWGVRRFQNKDGTRTAAGKKREAESLKSSQEAKNVNSKIHSYINKQLSSEDLDTGKSNFDFASDLIKDPDFEKVIMPVVQNIRQTKAKYGNKEPYDFTGDEYQAYMNDIDRLDKKTGELAITIGLAEKGESHKKSTPPEGEYERVDMFRYALARYLDEHSPDGYSDEGDWIYHSSMEGGLFIEDGTLYLSHHGIRGQRWGVRRFQNRDGSLTNAGRKRLGYATKGAAQTVGKAFKAGVKAGGNAVKAVKAHHEKKEAEKLQKKKEKASKTRIGVMANKDLFTNEEIRKLNERFKLEDEMKMATLQKGVEIAKAVGTIAQNVGTVAKTYEDVTGQSLSPIKRKAAEEKARQDKEDRERRIAREDADEARKAAKEERDIAIHEQTLRKAIASADTQEFTAQKTKAEADSSILDLYKKGQDFNGGSGTDASGQSWMEKATSGGKNPFFEEKLKNDPELAAAKAAHDAKAEWKQHEQERDARIAAREKEAAAKQSQPQQKQGGGDDDALFSQKGSLPINKDRYKNSRAIEKAKHAKEDAAEERTKKQDEKAVNRTIDDTIEANRSFKETVRAQDPHAYDRGVAKDYIKGKLNNLPNTLADLNPINRAAKKIADKAAKEEEAQVRKSMKDQYDRMVKSDGRDEANYVMYQTRVANLQQQGYSERKAKQIADSNPTFSAKRNRKVEYSQKVKDLDDTHRKNAKEINKANKELTDYYYKLINGPGYDPGTPKREELDRKYRQKRGELERLDKNNNEMLEKGMKEAKKILEHSFSIQNGVLFVDSSDGLAHHGVKGQRWGVRRFQNPDGTRTEAGKKHDAKLAAKAEKKAAKIAAKDAKRSAKAEKIRAKAVERYERKASLSRRESEAEAYKLVARDTKKASQKELLSDQKVSTTIAVGQGILGAIGLATYGVPTVAAIAGGAAIVGIMRNYNLETVRTGKTLNNLKRAEKERLAKSRATDQIMDDWREEGLGVRHFSIQNGTLFIDAGEPYLEHHGVKGMKWGKHLMAGKGVDSEAGGGGGFAEDDEKLKEMAKKAGMSVAEFRTKMAGKLSGAASKVGEKISVKDKHLVINGNRSSGTRSLAVGETGEKPKSFKEKAYNALGGKYKTQAADAHREMVQKRNDADDKARRANAQGRAANANKKAGNVREYMANKEGARQLDKEAKGARTSQWEATKKANRAQWKYDHSIAGLYDKATGKYKQVHKRTKVPKTMDQAAYYYSEGPNSKLHNNGSSKAKTAKDQAKAAVWNAADHQIKAKEYNDVANSYGGNTNYYGQAYKNTAERESRLSEASYRKAAELGKQASSETSTSSRPRARKKKHTSGGSGVTVRRPGRKPVSRTKRVTQSSTGVRRRGSTGSGRTVRRGV